MLEHIINMFICSTLHKYVVSVGLFFVDSQVTPDVTDLWFKSKRAVRARQLLQLKVIYISLKFLKLNGTIFLLIWALHIVIAFQSYPFFTKMLTM